MDFHELAWAAFSDNGALYPGRLHLVYEILAERETIHRAGDDAGDNAADLCYAWRAGLKR